MTRTKTLSLAMRLQGVWFLMITVLGGCVMDRHVATSRIENPFLGRMTIAVAPALNLSGSPTFDPDRFADAMAVELSYVEGIAVLPVSRVLAVMAGKGLEAVSSPTQALELARELGADALLVFAVTEYEPFDPPRIGVTAQLYGRLPTEWRSGLDPVTLSRRTSLDAERGFSARRGGLLAQAQRVFDASHESVAGEIRRFASRRDADGSAYGWRKYVVSQQHFIRFCCHATLREMFGEWRDSEGGPRSRPVGTP